MREIRTFGSMSGVGKRDDVGVATAPILDSTEDKGCCRECWWAQSRVPRRTTGSGIRARAARVLASCNALVET